MEVLPATHRMPRNWGKVDGVANIYPHALRLDLGELVYYVQGDQQKKGEAQQALHLHLGFGFNLRGEE